MFAVFGILIIGLNIVLSVISILSCGCINWVRNYSKWLWFNGLITYVNGAYFSIMLACGAQYTLLLKNSPYQSDDQLKAAYALSSIFGLLPFAMMRKLSE